METPSAKPDAWDRWTAHRETCADCVSSTSTAPYKPCPKGARLAGAMIGAFRAAPQSAQDTDDMGPGIYPSGGFDETGDGDTAHSAFEIGRC